MSTGAGIAIGAGVLILGFVGYKVTTAGRTTIINQPRQLTTAENIASTIAIALGGVSNAVRPWVAVGAGGASQNASTGYAP